MRSIEYTHSYLKDLKKAVKRGLLVEEINVIIEKLAKDEPLDEKHQDHALKGKYLGYRECHIRPDWLLVYKKSNLKENNKLLHILYLMRTGTHSDLF
jgi:mRNA interferase YafQ